MWESASIVVYYLAIASVCVRLSRHLLLGSSRSGLVIWQIIEVQFFWPVLVLDCIFLAAFLAVPSAWKFLSFPVMSFVNFLIHGALLRYVDSKAEKNARKIAEESEGGGISELDVEIERCKLLGMKHSDGEL